MDRERFIPVAKADLVDRLSHRLVRPPDREGFELFCRMLESLIHHDFHRLTEALKADNRPFNPDSDTRLVQKLSPQALATHEERLLATFKAVLNQANYRQITPTDLAYAIHQESLFSVNLFVDFADFENQLIFRRGARPRRIRRKNWLFRKEVVDITVYDRVALIT